MISKLLNICIRKQFYHRSHDKDNRRRTGIFHMQAMQKQRKINLTNLTCLYPNVHKSHVQNINIASIRFTKNKSSQFCTFTRIGLIERTDPIIFLHLHCYLSQRHVDKIPEKILGDNFDPSRSIGNSTLATRDARVSRQRGDVRDVTIKHLHIGTGYQNRLVIAVELDMRVVIREQINL